MNLQSLIATTAIASLCTLTACTSDKKNTNNNSASENIISTKIAYVDLDTLDAQYQYIIDGREKFEKEQITMEEELKRMEQNIKNQYAAIQKKIDDKTISQEELEKAGQRIQSLEQNFQQKMQGMQGLLMAKTDSFKTDYRKKVDDFLAAYNKDGKYDYILSYQYGVSLVLFANPALDITKDVVNGLNENYKKGKSPVATGATK
jgi:outer membrane protein